MVSWTASAMAIIAELEEEATRERQRKQIWDRYSPPRRPLKENGRKKRRFR